MEFILKNNSQYLKNMKHKTPLIFIFLLSPAVVIFSQSSPKFKDLHQCFFQKIYEKNLIEEDIFQLIKKECEKTLRTIESTFEKTSGSFLLSQKTNGLNIINYPEGGNYVGNRKDGKRNGQGTFTYSDGSKYIGEWKNGLKNGKGMEISPDGKKWTGEYKDGKRNGQGEYTWPNGSNYSGGYKNGLRNGQGIWTYYDGRKYVGEFKDGKLNG